MNEELLNHLRKTSWQDRAKSVAIYHAGRCREDSKHTIQNTAKELNRSIGRISEDLTLANWMKTHPRIKKFKNPSQALDYIKGKKKEMRENA